MLAAVTASTLSAEETKARIDAMTPILAELLGPEFFTRTTLAAAAAQIRFFPTPADIVAAIRPKKYWMTELAIRLGLNPKTLLPFDRETNDTSEVPF